MKIMPDTISAQYKGFRLTVKQNADKDAPGGLFPSYGVITRLATGEQYRKAYLGELPLWGEKEALEMLADWYETYESE